MHFWEDARSVRGRVVEANRDAQRLHLSNSANNGKAYGRDTHRHHPAPKRDEIRRTVRDYPTSAFLGWLGLLRRGLLSTAWILLLTPVHWLLLSLAAWRALVQLVAAPYAWEKTEHGLAKSSRRAANMTRSLPALERYLSALKESGELPALAPDISANAPVRRSRPRVAA
jgi:hypothetical protein